MKKFVSILLSIAVLASLLGFLPLQAQAAPTSRYFAETGHLMKDPFYSFWSNNGGLMIFGYPITSEFVENGMRVQYYERAVFEFHEDAVPEYQVQLRNVGSLVTAGSQFAPVPQFVSTVDRWFISETSHSLSFGFLDYWKKHGGVRVFGFPISEEFSQVNPIDGKTYTVQYFERARFEYHPEFKGTVYEVSLGHLGIQNANTVGVAQEYRDREPEPAPAPSPVETGDIVTLGWWGSVNGTVNARSGPSSASASIGSYSPGMIVKVLREVPGQEVNPGNNVWYQLDGGRYKGAYVYSGFITRMAQPAPDPGITAPQGVGADEVWVDVNLSKRVLTLMQGNKPVFVTYVSIGTARNPTVVGKFRIWVKYTKTNMAGRPPAVEHSYDLKDVPWTQYFYRGWALHGTYWHDNFTTARSAGCVNLTIGDAEYVFSKTRPAARPGAVATYPTNSDPGTWVVTHW